MVDAIRSFLGMTDLTAFTFLQGVATRISYLIDMLLRTKMTGAAFYRYFL
jgi:hypothetical protein